MQRRGKHSSTTIEAVFSVRGRCGGYITRFHTEKSLKSETVKYGPSPKGLGPRKTALARASGTYKRQTCPLVREGAPRNQERNCQTYSVFRTEKISGRKPRKGALYQDRVAD
jgi:hypothetical protein